MMAVKLPHNSNVLFVTAHPDDEAMFFVPTILELANHNNKIFILCLSDGDYEGMGEVRKKEFIEACGILGIRRNRCLIGSFPDHPDIDWDDREIAKQIQIAIEEEWKCEMRNIFTFDQYGVSGHLNHKCAARGVRTYVKKFTSTKAWYLESVSLMRKFLGMFDIPISYLMRSGTSQVMITHRASDVAKRAMEAHRSQWVWFRRLFVFFSRYMFVNTYSFELM
eukprot:TRINITY_DN844_c0_g1_i1.p1 TRINITY_DN844_c0_g1~~TRINITY_DN844_c0_g1_i1.p1  ORF type:complete len:222 (-),score=47.69 TRINITY_DN844_c0_g1_i1:82-747(-)